jgi:hypothetical protein
VLGGTPEQEVAGSQNAAGAVTLSESELAAAPGETASTTASVHNGGSQVEQFAVTVVGPAAEWAVVDPPTVQVYPGEHAECTVRLTPPRQMTTPPGRVWLTVRATSTLHPGLSVGADGSLDVGEFREVTATLVPQHTTGRWRTTHQVDLVNAGNVVEPVQVQAADPTGRFRFRVRAGELPVAPGRQAVPVGVRPPLRLLGKPQPCPFQVTVTPRPTLPPIRLDGTRDAVPLIGGWVPKLAAVIGALAILAATAAVILPKTLLRAAPASGTQSSAGPSPSPSVARPPATGGGSKPTTAASSPSATPSSSTSSPAAPHATPPPILAVVVDATGNKIRGNEAASPKHLGPGRYEVTFGTDMQNCSYVATVGGDPSNQAGSTAGLVFTASAPDNTNGVYVETKDLTGNLADRPFHLQAQCADKGRWVVVDPTGNKVQGNGVDSSPTHLGPGRYEVTFNTDMQNCSYVATIGGDPSNQLGSTAGLVFTASAPNNANGVYVETKNLSGNPLSDSLADRPFHLQAQCADQGRWAVVDPTGSALRGNGVNSSSKLSGTGRYEVTFNTDMRKCSYVATVGGDPSNQLGSTAGLVATASGPSSSNGVYVETKDLSGNLADRPFHLQTLC